MKTSELKSLIQECIREVLVEDSACRCGSGFEPWWEYDARGIPLTKVCEKCRKEKLSKYRKSVLADPDYDSDEPIDEVRLVEKADPKFEKRAELFVKTLQAKLDKYLKKQFPDFRGNDVTLSIDKGSKYWRIVRANKNGSSRSVYCFLNTQTGDVLKAASWKAPETKNPRGNIFDADVGMKATGPYGVVYMRGPSMAWTESTKKKSTPKLKTCEFCDEKKSDVKPRIDPYADKMYDGDSTPLDVCNSCARERNLK